MTEFLASYSGIFDLNSFVFVVVGLAALALTASFSKTSLTIAVDLAYPVGLLGTFIGLIGILQNMSDPEALGPAFANFFADSSLCFCDSWPCFRPVSRGV